MEFITERQRGNTTTHFAPTDFEKVMWLVTNRSIIYIVNLWTEEIALKFVLYAITHS